MLPDAAVVPQTNSPGLAGPIPVGASASEPVAPAFMDRPPTRPLGFRFTKEMRLLKGAEFQSVFSQKSSVSDKNMVLYLKSNNLGKHRVGLCISKKVTKNAPNRTLWKRMLREAFRLDHHSWPGNYDFVILSRTMRPPSLEVLRESFARLVRRGMTRPQQGYRSPRDNDKKPGNNRGPENPGVKGNSGDQPFTSAPAPGAG